MGRPRRSVLLFDHSAPMIFVTRDLYNGIQPDSGWERRAMQEWTRRSEIYGRYYDIINPLLPGTVRRLCKRGLHDARVEFASQSKSKVHLVMDLTHALSSFRGHKVQLTFSGVRRRIATRGLPGQWWLYEEVHLSSRAKYSLHVMLDKSDLAFEADDLLIEEA
jgi:hypothetical protein